MPKPIERFLRQYEHLLDLIGEPVRRGAGARVQSAQIEAEVKKVPRFHEFTDIVEMDMAESWRRDSIKGDFRQTELRAARWVKAYRSFQKYQPQLPEEIVVKPMGEGKDGKFTVDFPNERRSQASLWNRFGDSWDEMGFPPKEFDKARAQYEKPEKGSVH